MEGKRRVCPPPRTQTLFDFGVVSVANSVDEPEEVQKDGQPSGTCSNTDDNCLIESQTLSAATPGTYSATLEACTWGVCSRTP